MYMVAFMYPSASTPQDCSEFDYEHFVSVHLPMGLGLTKKYLGITPEKIVVYNPITDGEGAYAEWNTSMIRFGLDNSEIRIGGIVPIYGTGDLKVINDLHLSAGSVETRNFDSKKFAVGDELAVGYYPAGWFLAVTATLVRAPRWYSSSHSAGN